MLGIDLLYEGKAKQIYSTENDRHVIMYFKDDATAGNRAKETKFDGKGALNCSITTKLFNKISVPTHYVKTLTDREILVEKVDIIPIEVIVRNRAAGTFCKRYGLEVGTKLAQPIIEYCVKDDDLNDPPICEEAILALKLCSREHLRNMHSQSKYIRIFLTSIMEEIGFELIDFKLEFGITNDGQLVLADEICPDTMRLWKDNQSYDKDLFRLDSGDLLAGYREVNQRLDSIRWYKVF